MSTINQIQDILLAHATSEFSPFESYDVFEKLQCFGTDTALDALEWALGHHDPLMMLLALDVVPQFREHGNRLIPTLIKLISHPDRRVGCGAVSALGYRKSMADDAIPLIEPLLESTNKCEQLIAASSLWTISRHQHQEAAAVLRTRQTDSGVGEYASRSLLDNELEMF